MGENDHARIIAVFADEFAGFLGASVINDKNPRDLGPDRPNDVQDMLSDPITRNDDRNARAAAIAHEGHPADCKQILNKTTPNFNACDDSQACHASGCETHRASRCRYCTGESSTLPSGCLATLYTPDSLP